MKNRSSRFFRIAFLFCTGTNLSLPSLAQSPTDPVIMRCVTDEAERIKMERNSSYKSDRIKTEQLIQQYITDKRSTFRVAADEVIRIPVVVHVIHNQLDNKIGGVGNTNISDEQIRSQLTVLNEDYRKMAGTNGSNTNPVGADTKIEFELAQYDPDGHKVDGITRHYSKNTSYSAYTDDQLLAGIVSWPSDKYLNIWVCPLISGFLGVSQLPSTLSVDGLDDSKKDLVSTDGVIIDYRSFGSVEHLTGTSSITSTTYNLGRTTTHEVGHWLGLLHTWGSVENVCGTDYCDDTPQARAGNLTFVCDDRYVQCRGVTSKVMIENYMDYSADKCMNIFTQNQLDRIRAVLAVSPRRVALVKASKEGRLEPADNLTVELFPNPAGAELFANVRFQDFQSFTLAIYDQRGILQNVSSFKDVWSRKVPINTTKLMPGMYICKVSTGKETVSKRFFIN
jgi:hypothetical protein